MYCGILTIISMNSDIAIYIYDIPNLSTYIFFLINFTRSKILSIILVF